ncbi:MAG: methionine synthase [Nostocaceae cyanobacterium]|nr:methionine synthase [Nostocaceae cyanobacterium]
MNKFGVYTLANDVVYDQLIALLNSIEVNIDPDIPICVIPYDSNIDKITAEIQGRDNVRLFENRLSMRRWENFYNQVWNAHPQASLKNQGLSKKWYKKSGLFRKMCAFDGQFEQFVFYDADSLAMSPLHKVIEKLKDYDFIFDDWEHKKASNVAALNFGVIKNEVGMEEVEVRKFLHCSSFFGSKRDLFPDEQLDKLIQQFIENREFTWINERSWWCDADLFSYMTLRCNSSLFNFTLSPNGKDRTGNCADADPFVNINNVLYNQEGLKPIHRLHYMNYPSIDFSRLCKGEDVNIRYQEEFLYYRFLQNPEQRPKELKPPSLLSKMGRTIQKIIHKFK